MNDTKKHKHRIDYYSLVGTNVGDILVLDVVKRKNVEREYVELKCLCHCGNIFYAHAYNIISKHTSSCGCLGVINATHRDSKSKEYVAWCKIKHRCYNKNNKAYCSYGGRGIKVCDKWINSYQSFLEDMGRAPSKKHSIDRIDNNGDYCPENCRWATSKEQSSNKRSTIFLTYNNETKPLIEWCFEFNMERGTVLARIKRGWTIEDALTIPALKNNNWSTRKRNK